MRPLPLRTFHSRQAGHPTGSIGPSSSPFSPASLSAWGSRSCRTMACLSVSETPARPPSGPTAHANLGRSAALPNIARALGRADAHREGSVPRPDTHLQPDGVVRAQRPVADGDPCRGHGTGQPVYLPADGVSAAASYSCVSYAWTYSWAAATCPRTRRRRALALMSIRCRLVPKSSNFRSASSRVLTQYHGDSAEC